MVTDAPGWPDLELLEAAPILIWRSGVDGLCDWFNSAWLQYRGRRLEQEIGNGWAEGVHPDDMDACLRVYRDAFAERQRFDMEYRILRADGQFGWIVDYGVPIFAGDGRFLGYVGYCFDVSDRKRADQALALAARRQAEARAEAEQANRAKSELLSAVTHDLHQPLRAAELILYRCRGDASGGLATNLDKALASCHIAADMLDGLITYGKLERGQLRPRLQQFPLSDTLEDIFVIAESLACRRSNLLQMVMPSAWVTSDPALLRRVLLNLVTNALHHTPAGRKVLVGARRSGAAVRIEVCDTGNGFHTEAPSEAGDVSLGLGIGLKVVSEVCRLLGHGLEFRSKPGRGSCVGVTVPATFPDLRQAADDDDLVDA
jgi:PAS domain S-box-containing protein